MDYECGPSSALVIVTDKREVYGDDEDFEDQEGDEDGDDESYGDGDVQANRHVSSFLTIHQRMEDEQGRYVFLDVASCDVSNNSYLEDPEKSSLLSIT